MSEREAFNFDWINFKFECFLIFSNKIKYIIELQKVDILVYNIIEENKLLSQSFQLKFVFKIKISTTNNCVYHRNN